MTDEFEWDHDTLEVQDDGHVDGSAYLVREDGVSVDVGVISYEYHGGDLNHVPNIIVSDKNGHILTEVHAHDSQRPEQAIGRAKQSGKNVFQNLEQYIEDKDLKEYLAE